MISRSPTDVQPVFDAIVGNAVRLCDAIYGMIWRYEGETVHLAGVHNFPDAELEQVRGDSRVLTERMFGELNEYVKDISASGTHLLSLINDILDLSKIEAGRMKLEVTEFDLPSAVENALILVRARASRRGIMLGRTIDPRAGLIRADERKVKQVLSNLLSNALTFTPGGGRIDVRAGSSTARRRSP